MRSQIVASILLFGLSAAGCAQHAPPTHPITQPQEWSYAEVHVGAKGATQEDYNGVVWNPEPTLEALYVKFTGIPNCTKAQFLKWMNASPRHWGLFTIYSASDGEHMIFRRP